MDQHLTTIILVGRPNVGKSTLMNRLIGHRRAIEHETAHTTRDVVFGIAPVGDGAVQIADTAGDDMAATDEIMRAAQQRRQDVIGKASAIIFVFDGQEGMTAEDQRVLRSVRKAGLPFIVAATKCDNPTQAYAALEEAQGLHDAVVAVSSIHKDGITELQALLEPYAQPYTPANATNVVLLGRQNAGKSTLFNVLTGESQSIVSTIPGTTRDIIVHELQFADEPIKLFDTAGLMKRSRAMKGLDRYATLRLEEVVVDADVVILCVDGTEHVAAQDAKIAQKALTAGAAVVIAVTKWDAVTDEKAADRWHDALLERFHFAPWLPVVFISSMQNINLDPLREQVVQAAVDHRFSIEQKELNAVVAAITASRPRLRVVTKLTQSGTRPPTFTAKVNGTWNVYDKRQFVNLLRKEWKLTATPIVLREDLVRGQRRERQKRGRA